MKSIVTRNTHVINETLAFTVQKLFAIEREREREREKEKEREREREKEKERERAIGRERNRQSIHNWMIKFCNIK